MNIDCFVPEFADRTPQVKVFKRILEGEETRSAFLITGPAEIGKSFLVSQFQHMARDWLCSWYEFRDEKEHNFLSLILNAVWDLGGAQVFNETLNQIRRRTERKHDIHIKVEDIRKPRKTNGGVSIGGVRDSSIRIGGHVVGGDYLQFNVPIEDPLQYLTLRDEITGTFFKDLATLAKSRKVMLIYDSFEYAPQEAREWLVGTLLNEMTRGRLPGVVTLMAGRNIPETTHLLKPITVITELRNFGLLAAARYWVRHRGLPLRDLPEICEMTGGNPKRLAEEANRANGTPLEYRALVI